MLAPVCFDIVKTENLQESDVYTDVETEIFLTIVSC